jgi:hypothetical protein
MSDFLNEQETNKYLIHVKRGEDLILNLHIQEGDV